MTEPTTDSTLRCRYRHCVCLNPRTTKRDGSLHQLCVIHQERANYNQRIFVARRLERQRKLNANQQSKRKTGSGNRVVAPRLVDIPRHSKEARELEELDAAIREANQNAAEIDEDLKELLAMLDMDVDLDPFVLIGTS